MSQLPNLEAAWWASATGTHLTLLLATLSGQTLNPLF